MGLQDLLNSAQGVKTEKPVTKKPGLSGLLESSTPAEPVVQAVAQVKPIPEPVPQEPKSLFSKYQEFSNKTGQTIGSIGENIVKTFATEQGREALKTTTIEGGVPGIKNVVQNYNDLVYGVMERGFGSIGAGGLANQAESRKLQARSLAKEANNEVRNFITKYDAGDERTFMQRITSPGGEKEVAKLVGTQLPTFLAMMGIGVASRGASVPAMFATSFALNSGDAYQQAKDYVEAQGKEFGPKEEKAMSRIAILTGATTAPLDTFGMSRILGSANVPVVKQTLIRNIMERVVDTGVNTVAEGGTEALQEIIQNAWAKTYDEHLDILQGVPEALFGGGITGGGASMALHATGLLLGAKTPQEEKTKLEESGLGENVRDAITTNGREQVVEELQTQLSVDRQTAERIVEISVVPTGSVIPASVEDIQSGVDEILRTLTVQRDSTERRIDVQTMETQDLIEEGIRATEEARKATEEEMAVLQKELEEIRAELEKRPEPEAQKAVEEIKALPAPKATKEIVQEKPEEQNKIKIVREDTLPEWPARSPANEAPIAEFKKRIQAGEKIPPIVVDAGGVIDGHNRLAAYRDLGIKDIPTIEYKQGMDIGPTIKPQISPKRAEAEKKHKEAMAKTEGTAEDKAKAEAFPVGVGFGTAKQQQKGAESIDRTIKNATKEVEARKKLKDIELAEKAYEKMTAQYTEALEAQRTGKTKNGTEITKEMAKELKAIIRRLEVKMGRWERMYKFTRPSFEASPKVEAGSLTLESAYKIVDDIRTGKTTAEELKKNFEQFVAQKSALVEEIGRMKKEEIIKKFKLYARVSDKKDHLVDRAYNSMIGAFHPNKNFSYSPFSESVEQATARIVATVTDEDIQVAAKERAEYIAQRKAEMEKIVEGMKNPQTLEDFRNLADANGLDSLTQEQRKRYDELQADKVKADTEAKIKQKALVRGVNAGVSFELQQTKHTKTGADLYVVTMSSRVETETYRELVSAAKRLGGYYSSFRGSGAIPGFQFKTAEDAQTFMQAGQGENVDASAKIEAKQEEQKAKTTNKLAALAEQLEERATEKLNQDRKTNTAKRAREASGAEADARADIQLARTMKNLASAIESGRAKYLDGITAKTHVEELESALHQAKWKQRNLVEGKYRRDHKDDKGLLYDPSDVNQKNWGTASLSFKAQQEINKLKEEVENGPVTDETISAIEDIFPEFVGGNVVRDIIEPAMQKKGFKLLANRYLKIIPKGDKRWSPKSFEQVNDLADMMKAVDTHGMYSYGIERAQRLQRMGVVSTPQFRAMLREYVTFRGDAVQEDKAKELERSLVGAKVGFDFFPTPPGVANNMVRMAEIKEGMKVLEPSAGNGNIAGAIWANSGIQPDVIEISSQLREVLEAKGYNVVGQDFLDFNEGGYDVIVMNPPFSNNADIAHVRHAYDLLAPGGKLVSIVGEGAFFRSGKTETEFRDWLDTMSADVEQLPAGTFKDTSLMATTGANGRMVVIEKPEVAFMRRDERGRFAEEELELLTTEDIAGLNEVQKENYEKYVVPQLEDIPTPQEGERLVYFSGHDGKEGEYVDTDLFRALDRGSIKNLRIMSIPNEMLETTGSEDKDAVGERKLATDVSFLRNETLHDAESGPMADPTFVRQQVASFADRLNLDISIHFVDKIYTGEKSRAVFAMNGEKEDVEAWAATLGKDIVFEKGVPKYTPAHEVLHFVINNLDQMEADFGVSRLELLTAQNGGKMPRTRAEEQKLGEELAHGFEEAWEDSQQGKTHGFKGVVGRFFDRLIAFVKQVLAIPRTSEETIRQFYDKALYMRRRGAMITDTAYNLKQFETEPGVLNFGVQGDFARKEMSLEEFEKLNPSEMSVDEFDALDPSDQLEVFDRLPEDLQREISNREIMEDIAGYYAEANPLERMVNDILDGKRKIRKPDSAKAELREGLGAGLYMQLVRNDPTKSSIDELVQEVRDQGTPDLTVSDMISAIFARHEVRKLAARQLSARRKAQRDAKKRELAQAKTEAERNKIIKDIERSITKELLAKRYTVKQYVNAIERGRKEGLKSGLKVQKDRTKRLQAFKDALFLSDKDVRSILGNRDYRQMSDKDFDNFLGEMETVANMQRSHSEAMNSLQGMIFEKGLVHVENLQALLGLPKSISDMTTQQLQQFEQILSKYQVGDVFLGVRTLETIDRTDLAGIRTYREARERLAKETGVSMDELQEIKVGELDRFRWDAILYERNVFYRLLIDTLNRAFLKGDSRTITLEKKLNGLLREARKSRMRGRNLWQKILYTFVPTDEKIFAWMEADQEGKMALGKEMTREEMAVALFMQEYFEQARDHLVANEMMKQYRDNYIRHIRRGFLEAWKEDGVKTSISEILASQEQDLASFTILDKKTGQILPIEKYFSATMHRTGKIVPTKNVASAFMSYAKEFERKKEYDSILPKIHAYTRALTPLEKTKGGVFMDESLQTFVNTWINSKKGRRAEPIWNPGGKIDWVVRTIDVFLTIKFLGFNVASGLTSHIGEFMGMYYTLGEKDTVKGIARLATPKGRKFVAQYEEFVGRTPWDSLQEMTKGMPERLFEFGLFGLFKSGTVRANKIHLLGSITDQEWKTGEVSPERLAEMKIELGRWRVVEGAESIMGATTIGSVAKRFKTWAFVMANRAMKDITEVGTMLASKDAKVFSSREFRELVRVAITGAAISLIVAAMLDEEDTKYQRGETFLQELRRKAIRDAYSVFQAASPATLMSAPVMADWFIQLGKALQSLVTLEEYKTTKKGEYKKGDLKAIPQLERLFTPSIFN